MVAAPIAPAAFTLQCATRRFEGPWDHPLQGQVIIESGLVLTGITITRVCFQRR